MMTDRTGTGSQNLGGVTITRAEQIAWQRPDAALLAKLLELAGREGLPAITWTVQSAGASVAGQVLSHPDAQRREAFNAWRAAITSAAGRAPEADREVATQGGETRLVAAWEHLPIGLTLDSKRYPVRAGVTLTASIWPGADDDDDLTQAGQ